MNILIDTQAIIWFAENNNHILENERIPLLHRDPFDRLIIAQAIAENMSIVSSDAIFDAYSVLRIW